MDTAITFTPFGNNTFTLTGCDTKILVDPFFTGEVVFSSPYLFAFPKHPSLKSLDPGNYNAIVLTQHLPDHMHIPTISLVDRSVPIYAPAQCEQVLKEQLGFKHVFTVGDKWLDISSDVQITSEGGSSFAIVFKFGDKSIYYEMHGLHNEQYLAKLCNQVDAAIVPAFSFSLMRSLFRLVTGAPEAAALGRILQPKTLIAMDNSTLGLSRGVLSWITTELDERPQMVSQFGTDKQLSDIKLELPQPGDCITF